jgi:hypothetical protein
MSIFLGYCHTELDRSQGLIDMQVTSSAIRKRHHRRTGNDNAAA